MAFPLVYLHYTPSIVQLSLLVDRCLYTFIYMLMNDYVLGLWAALYQKSLPHEQNLTIGRCSFYFYACTVHKYYIQPTIFETLFLRYWNSHRKLVCHFFYSSIVLFSAQRLYVCIYLLAFTNKVRWNSHACVLDINNSRSHKFIKHQPLPCCFSHQNYKRP